MAEKDVQGINESATQKKSAWIARISRNQDLLKKLKALNKEKILQGNNIQLDQLIAATDSEGKLLIDKYTTKKIIHLVNGVTFIKLEKEFKSLTDEEVDILGNY